MGGIFYEGVQEMARSIRKIDKEYLITDHELKGGDEVPIDIHESNEWIFFEPGVGIAEITVGRKAHIVELDLHMAKTFFIKKGKKHSLRAFAPMAYTVVRDGFK